MLAAAATVVSGCFNLDEEAYSEIVQKDFVPSASDVASLTASAYTPLAYFMDWQGYFDAQEEPSDEFITPVRPNGWDDGGTYQRMHKHTWTNQEWQPWNTYQTPYEAINNANRVLGQIEDGSLATGDQKETIEVGLRAVRALWYWILLNNHGNVPIVTSFSADVPKQATRQEVYDFVVSELTDCLSSGKLSKEKNGASYTQLNYWSTEMILMRTYLNAEVYTGTAQWEKALACAEDIINNGPYTLSADYSDNFKVDLSESNTEVMLAVPYDSKIKTGDHVFNENAKFYPPVSKNYFGWSYQCWGGACANPQFVDSYQPGDLRKEKTWMYGPAKKGDTYVWTNLNYLPSLTSKDDDKGGSMTSIDFGLRQNKYEQDVETSFYWSNDISFFRLAEAYYTKAECLLRLGQRLDEAVAAVNAVDARVGRTVTLADLQGNSKMDYGTLTWGALTKEMWESHDPSHNWDDVVAELESSQKRVKGAHDNDVIPFGGMYDEWGWEFCLEGIRRTTMIRFGTFTNRGWFNHEPEADDHTALFPIPLEVLQSNPNIKQNPGYVGTDKK